MRGELLKFPTVNAQLGNVWCEPLKLHFPQVVRLVRHTSALSAAGLGSSLRRPHVKCEYSLHSEPDPEAGIVAAVPVDRLQPGEEKSLIVRHHWSDAMANAYLLGVEDMEPDQPYGSIYETDRAIFTISKCRTRSKWPGPTIFYLADIFEDDASIGVYIWETSLGADGQLRETDIFYSDD